MLTEFFTGALPWVLIGMCVGIAFAWMSNRNK